MSRELIYSTLLAQRPRENSFLVALACVMGLLVVSVYGWRGGGEAVEALAAIPSSVFGDGEYYRLITAQGVHADVGHFLRNAVLYGLFAYLLFGYFGFWIFPVGTTLGGGLVNALALLTYPASTRLVGASGDVYLMASFWLTLYLLIERRHSWRKRFLHVIGVGMIVLMPTSLRPEVSYRTHAIGAGIGIAAGLLYFLFRKQAIRAAEIRLLEEDGAEPLAARSRFEAGEPPSETIH